MNKLIIISILVVFALLISGCIIDESMIFENTETNEPVVVGLNQVFSGEGNYDCILDVGNLEMQVYVKDEKVRIETKDETTVLNGNFYYTKKSNDDKWSKKEVDGELKIITDAKTADYVSCSESEIEDSIFNITDNLIKTDAEESEEAEIPESMNDCEGKVSVSRDVCIKTLAIVNEDASLCKELTVLSVEKCRSIIEEEEIIVAECESQDTTELKDVCYNDKAWEEDDELYCAQISNESLELKDNCYKTIAVELKDASVCAQMIYANNTDTLYAKDVCYKNVAVALKDESLCRQIAKSFKYQSGEASYTRDECYSAIIDEYNDVTICDNMISKDMKDDCYSEFAIYSEDETVCNSLSEDGNFIKCVTDVGIDTGNFKVCKMLPGKEYQDCLNSIAEESATLEVCQQMPVIDDKEDCYYRVATKEDEEDYKICNMIEFDGLLKTDCYKDIAIATENYELCGKMSWDKQGRVECYHEIAFNTFNLDLCKMITSSTEDFAECYSNVAIDVEDSFICESISGDVSQTIYHAKNFCYYNYALGTLDVSACAKTKGEMTDTCYYDYAVKFENIDICDKIEDATDKRHCKEDLE
ncbi:MAG: hypothetical protein V1672_01465 [Candidatus Diapherotrites archaeon]